jgi:hypothetical protein
VASEMDEVIARVIHDMRNDTQMLVGILYGLEHGCTCKNPKILVDFESCLRRLTDAFPELIDLLFEEDGTVKRG